MDYALGSGIVLLLGFISSPLNTRLFTPEEFGKFSMFNLFSSVLAAIILMGLDQAFVRYFYEEEESKRPKLLFETLKIPLITCTIVGLLTIIFSKDILIGLFGDFSFRLLIIIIINNYFLLLVRYVQLVVRMQQRGKVFSILQVFQKIITIILIVLLFLVFENDFMVLIYASVFSNFALILLGVYLERKFWFKEKKYIKISSSNKEMFKYGFPLIFTFLITWLFQSADRLFIKHYQDYSELGIYAAAFSIVALLNAAQSAFTMFWVPVAYERYSKNPKDKKFFQTISKIVAFAMFFCSISLILFKDIVILILGSDYRMASFIMPFLIFMPVMYTISETTVMGINFAKKSKYHIFIALSCAILNILGNLFLVPSLGAKGAAISTGISYILFFTLRTFISMRFYPNKYGLGKIYLVILNISIFAFYATFREIDLMYVFLGVENYLFLFLLYKGEINVLLSKIKLVLKNKI